MSKPDVRPSTAKTAFSCPHCGAYTTQYWRSLKATFRESENTPPFRVRDLEGTKALFLDDMPAGDSRDDFERHLERLHTGLPFIEGKHERYTESIQNADVSECYNCKKLSFWIGEELAWPQASLTIAPNTDMPEAIQRDFLEAGHIVGKSPRGAAALLRLCVQNLCIELGEKGKNINDDIAALVKKGLDPRIQKMLDVVRVVGNNAVHPGELDIRDDLELAVKLFELVNLIVDALISQPKAIDTLYGALGSKTISAIERRDDN